MKIIATLLDRDRTVPRRAVGVGRNDTQAIKATLASARLFVDEHHINLLVEDIRRALAYASPDSFEMGAESASWSVYIQPQDDGTLNKPNHTRI